MRWRGLLLLCWVGCTKPAPPPLQRVHVDPAMQELVSQTLDQSWSLRVTQEKRRIADREAALQIRLWTEPVQEELVLYLVVVWPQSWLKPRSSPLASPTKLGMALPNTPTAEQYKSATQELVNLFWVQVQLAQSRWPISAELVGPGSSIPVRAMSAEWLGRHGKPDPSIANGCLGLLAHALQNPRKPQLDRLESSVACLSKVGDPSIVAKVLDLMPNGHLRVEMLRVELLGELGGALARDHLLWVQAQAEDPALARAATLGLEAIDKADQASQ